MIPETKKLIAEIINSSNDSTWNFIKTTSTIIEFVNYLKTNRLEENIEYFSISSNSELIINEVINRISALNNTQGTLIYSQDFNLKLESILLIEPKYWLIFFRAR